VKTYRLRAHLRFRLGNGMAAWAIAQNTVRLGMAYHLNEGRADEERSRQSAASDVYECDLAFPEEALAVDTWNTLLAVCVDGYLEPADSADQLSWMNLHECHHDGTTASCPPPSRVWQQAIAVALSAWKQPTGAHDAYSVGSVVTHQGFTWRSTLASNVWEPGVAGWVQV
jgi:hypothetical protein